MPSNPPTARGGTASSTTAATSVSSSSEVMANESAATTATSTTTTTTLATETPKQNGTRYFVGEQGKRARFYRNGDQFFKGLWYTISAFRSWNSLLEDLNQHLGDSIALPHGVRFVFTVDGVPRFSLEELEHGLSYVCSSTDKFKAIDYANASQPMWSFVSSQRSTPPSRSSVIRIRCEKEPNDFVKPRIITIIRNGLKPRRVVRHLLNKRTAQSFEHVMQDITAIVKLNSGVVRKLYALSGKQITCLADFFDEDYVFVAYGPEKVSLDDFYVISEEYKRMNLRGGIDGKRGAKVGPAGRREMPVRNDGFRRTLSPDIKSKMAQLTKLPPELADRIKIVDLLGDGNTAFVFKALFKNQVTQRSHAANASGSFAEQTPLSARSASPDALKVISKESAEENPDFVEMEIKLLSEVKHAHIVEMKEYHVFDNNWYIRMELMEDGDLFEYLKEKRTLNEPNAASCISCLCDALDYLHNRNIVHRDVKPENLLIYTCRDTGLLKLKLADFGLASRVEPNELLYHLCGTPTYVAPEVLAEFGYSYKADCWSVGVILYILLCGFPPFGMDEDLILFNKIIRGVFDFPSPSFDEISYASRLLIRRLLSTEPKTRFSAREVVDYFWVAEPGHTTPMEEVRCMAELDEAMAAFRHPSHNDFEESDTEYFYSRRASMDEFSDHQCGDNSSSNSFHYEPNHNQHSGAQTPKTKSGGSQSTSARRANSADNRGRRNVSAGRGGGGDKEAERRRPGACFIQYAAGDDSSRSAASEDDDDMDDDGAGDVGDDGATGDGPSIDFDSTNSATPQSGRICVDLS